MHLKIGPLCERNQIPCNKRAAKVTYNDIDLINAIAWRYLFYSSIFGKSAVSVFQYECLLFIEQLTQSR
jgi:hypothetical protein